MSNPNSEPELIFRVAHGPLVCPTSETLIGYITVENPFALREYTHDEKLALLEEMKKCATRGDFPHEVISQEQAREFMQVAALVCLDLDVLADAADHCKTVEEIRNQIAHTIKLKDEATTDKVARERRYSASLMLFSMTLSNSLGVLPVNQPIQKKDEQKFESAASDLLTISNEYVTDLEYWISITTEEKLLAAMREQLSRTREVIAKATGKVTP